MINFRTAFRLLKTNRHEFLNSVFTELNMRGWLTWISDPVFLRICYRRMLGRRLNLKNPQSFNEKLQWLKLYNRKPEYTTMVDKYAVKAYVSGIIGEEYIIPTIGIWNKPEEIEWDSLPNQFVLKTTHGGGNTGVVICNDKSTFNKEEAVRKLNKSLSMDLYDIWREWPYKNVKKRVIAEKYIAPDSENINDSKKSEIFIKQLDLCDYKFFCFNGKCEYFKIDFDRFTSHHANYFNKNCELMRFGEIACPPDFDKHLTIPSNINHMIELAEQVASKIGSPFVRVDFYSTMGHIYFGEITFYPAAGFGKFIPEDCDLKWGYLLELPDKSNC